MGLGTVDIMGLGTVDIMGLGAVDIVGLGTVNIMGYMIVTEIRLLGHQTRLPLTCSLSPEHSLSACSFISRLEDGTVPFLSVVALSSGFETLYRIGGSMEETSQRTFKLAR